MKHFQCECSNEVFIQKGDYENRFDEPDEIQPNNEKFIIVPIYCPDCDNYGYVRARIVDVVIGQENEF